MTGTTSETGFTSYRLSPHVGGLDVAFQVIVEE